VRQDDASIPNETHLLRALPFEGWWKADADRIRVSSVAFNDGNGETSCYLDTVARRSYFATRYPERPAARFNVGQARSCGFSVTSDPDGDPDSNPEHLLLTHVYAGVSRSKYHRACKELALLSEFLDASHLRIC
jgi:hypothetical protein